MNTVTISLEKYEDLKNEIKKLQEFIDNDKTILIKHVDAYRTRYSTRLIDDVYKMHEQDLKYWKDLYHDEMLKTEFIKSKIKNSIICKLLKIKL